MLFLDALKPLSYTISTKVDSFKRHARLALPLDYCADRQHLTDSLYVHLASYARHVRSQTSCIQKGAGEVAAIPNEVKEGIWPATLVS